MKQRLTWTCQRTEKEAVQLLAQVFMYLQKSLRDQRQPAAVEAGQRLLR